jgi:hypothetical protein
MQDLSILEILNKNLTNNFILMDQEEHETFNLNL